MSDSRFCHFRRINPYASSGQKELYATLCTIEMTSGVFGIGLAVKSESDNASKELGKTIAKKRAEFAISEKLGDVPSREASRLEKNKNVVPRVTRGIWRRDQLLAFIQLTRKDPDGLLFYAQLAKRGELLWEAAEEGPSEDHQTVLA